MKDAIRMVREFHLKNNLFVDQSLRSDVPDSPRNDAWLRAAGQLLVDLSLQIERASVPTGAGTARTPWDPRLNRAHLMIEELGELLLALADCDELLAFDGLCDLLYVVIGTGVQLSLPLAQGMAEVHRSNMTKERAVTDPDGRVRSKGPNYSPPDLKPILQARAYPED